MARFVYELNTKVFWCVTIASKSAPTVAEINAGTNITSFLTKDGVSRPATQNMVSSGSLAESYNAEVVGSWGGGAFELKGYRDDVADSFWNLGIYSTNGFLVIIPRGTVAAANKCEVWPAQMHTPIMGQTAQDEVQAFTLALAITSQPEMKATIA